MTPRERNQAMAARIRSGDLNPYSEGGYVLRVLSTPGRISGESRSWPIAVVQYKGQRYICGPNRQRDWVRNLLASGWCTVEGDDPERQSAELIENDDAAQAVATYLGQLGRPSAMWPFPTDAPVSTIREHIGSIAVFRLTTPG
jgi:hypothetical protein